MRFIGIHLALPKTWTGKIRDFFLLENKRVRVSLGFPKYMPVRIQHLLHACSHLMPFSLHSQLPRWGLLPQIPPLWYERFFGEGFQIVHLAITVRLTKISKYQARTLLTLLKVGICCFKNSVALRQTTV